MSGNSSAKYRESAMRDGTILGLLWIATFAVSVVMFKSIDNGYGLVASFATAVLSMMSPCMVYRLATRHRNNECGGTMTYGEAWLYVFIMYLCAIVLASLAQYIFYAFIDPHMFGDIIPVFVSFAKANNLPAESIELFVKMFETLENTGAADKVISQLSGHISRDIIITTFLAVAIRRTPENNI